jgi:hypothetical protein
MKDITHPHLVTTLNERNFPTNSLSLLHTNICSLPHKYLLLQEHLATFTNPPDIIALSENRLTDDINPNSFPINGYSQKHKYDITIYHKHNLHISYLDHINIPQAATIILQIHSTERKTDPIHTIINIYRRPLPNPQFPQDLESAINEILTAFPKTSITIQGDININLLQLTPHHPMTRLLLTNNLNTTITTPTRYDPHHNTATLIDVILTTLTETHITSGTISPPLSDHLLTYAIFHKPPPRQQNKTKCKTLSQGRYERMKNKITNKIKTEITKTMTTSKEDTTTNQHFHNIQQAIQEVIEQHETIPKRPRKAWCNPKIKRQIKKQHKLHHKCTENPTQENITKHKNYRNKINTDIKTAKKQHLETQLKDCKHNPKKQAKILRSILPSRSQHRTSPTTINYEGKTYTDPTDIANALNDRFITIGHKTSQTLPQQQNDAPTSPTIPPADPPNTSHPPFKLSHTTTEIITNTMKKIDRNKTNDIFKIKPAILQDLTDFIAPILETLFNKAIDEQKYPDPLKITKLIELYKTGDKTNPANYRPISLLPIIAKIFDTIINNQLMKHLLDHNIISPTQYAFRPNSSTTLAIQTILNNIHKHKNKKQPLLAIYIDLSKAYDTVSHKKLLDKLKHDFNFTTQTINFFSSYFQNRQQSTHTQHAKSKTQTITHGIPQGSTLSTTFFLLYINDIIKTTPKSKVYTYADDTTLIITASTLQDLQTLAQSELSNLINYFHSNNLVPNPTKTNYSIFYPRNSQPIQLNIADTILEQKDKAKLLGFMIQDNLKNHQTINNIIKKLRPTIYSFRYANKLLSTTTMKEQYYSLVYPHLINGISIWGSSNKSKTHLQPLNTIHKKIIRLLVNLPPRTHTAPIMLQLHILNIYNLYTLRVCAEVYPFIHPKKQPNRPEHNHNYQPVSHIHEYPTRYSLDNHMFIPNTHQHIRRNSNTRTPKHTTAHFTAKNMATWNTIPVQIRSITSYKVFMKKTKHFLLNQQKRPT